MPSPPRSDVWASVTDDRIVGVIPDGRDTGVHCLECAIDHDDSECHWSLDDGRELVHLADWPRNREYVCVCHDADHEYGESQDGRTIPTTVAEYESAPKIQIGNESLNDFPVHSLEGVLE